MSKTITSINILTADLPSSQSSRNLVIKGFSDTDYRVDIIRNTDKYTYDFTTNTFTSAETRLEKRMSGTGSDTHVITFPSTTVDREYTIKVTPTLFSKEIDGLLNNVVLKQYKDVNITFSVLSHLYSSKWTSMPANVVASKKYDAIDTSNGNFTNISWQVSCYQTDVSNAVVLNKGIKSTHWESSETQTVNGTVEDSADIVLDALGDVVLGMTVSGGGLGTGITVTAIDTALKKITVSESVSVADDVTLTFTAYGEDAILAHKGVRINFETLSVEIDPATVTVNGTVTNSTSVILDHVRGVEDGSGANVTGIGISCSSSANVIAGIDFGTKTMTLTGNQTLEDNTVLKLNKSGVSATIKVDVDIIRAPKKDVTLTLDIDKILLITGSI